MHGVRGEGMICKAETATLWNPPRELMVDQRPVLLWRERMSGNDGYPFVHEALGGE